MKEDRRKQIENRRVNLGEYMPMLERTLDEDSLNVLLHIFGDYLPCAECKKVMSVNDFAVSKANKARMHRYSVCKSCSREMYTNMRDSQP